MGDVKVPRITPCQRLVVFVERRGDLLCRHYRQGNAIHLRPRGGLVVGIVNHRLNVRRAGFIPDLEALYYWTLAISAVHMTFSGNEHRGLICLQAKLSIMSGLSVVITLTFFYHLHRLS